MRRSTIRKIEDILRDYPKIDDYIEEREQQLRYPAGQTDENIGGGYAAYSRLNKLKVKFTEDKK